MNNFWTCYFYIQPYRTENRHRMPTVLQVWWRWHTHFSEVQII
jgi:hypothetical protein